MAHLDDILNKYVKPGAEAQGLQASAFIVKDKNGPKSRPFPKTELWLNHSAIAGKTLYSNALGKLNYESGSPPFTRLSLLDCLHDQAFDRRERNAARGEGKDRPE
jgi:hypothetical protein